MPLLIQRTHSSSNKELRKTAPFDVQAKKAAPSQKSLSFSKRVNFQEIPHLLELSQEEIEATWLTKQECKAIRSDAVQVVKRMVYNNLQEDDCVRGLENRAPEAHKRRKQNKRNAFQIVCDEQEDQWEDGITDHEVISIRYQIQTFKSREAAREVGIQDELEAKRLSSQS
ncbi:MAG: hypothetical protein SGBAC_011899 [Bacillariaceae sp.]